MAMRDVVVAAACGVMVAAAATGRAADWLEFRGADGRGVAAGETIRTAWSEAEGVAWKADLPGRSASSPIVVGDLVVTTASSGARQDRLHVIALDRATGRRRWERTLWATGRTLCHPTSAVAAGTPASDGERIVALFSSCDLVCLDLTGRLLWQRNLAVEHPRAGNDVGMGSSPRIVGDTVVVQIDCQGDPFAAGVDLATGDDRWSVARDRVASWSSPLPLTAGDRPGVLLQNPNGLELRAVADGAVAWRWPGDCAGIATTAVAGETLFVPAGGITAVATGGREPKWQAAKLSPGIASPVAWNGSVAVLNRGGVLAVGDAADGSVRGQVRLAGSFWASPIIVGGLLVAVNTEGKTFLVSLEDRPEIVAENELPGTFTATPAVADGSLYLRSDAALWKVAAPD
jgi:outer membrane protein assembly factor BamB